MDKTAASGFNKRKAHRQREMVKKFVNRDANNTMNNFENSALRKRKHEMNRKTSHIKYQDEARISNYDKNSSFYELKRDLDGAQPNTSTQVRNMDTQDFDEKGEQHLDSERLADMYKHNQMILEQSSIEGTQMNDVTPTVNLNVSRNVDVGNSKTLDFGYMVESAENTYIEPVPKGFKQKESRSTRQSLLKQQNPYSYEYRGEHQQSGLTAVSQVNNDPRMNYTLKIQSSKAFSNNDHENLRDILQKLEKSAVAKKMAEIEASKNGDQKKVKSRDVSVKKIQSEQEKDKQEKLRKFLEKEKQMQTDRLIYQAMKIPHKQDQQIAPKIFSRPQVGSHFDNRSKSTIKPSSNSNIDITMSRQKQHASKLSSVNSYKYLQNQWPEINVNSITKREFVRSLAKEQIHNNPPAYQGDPQLAGGKSVFDQSISGADFMDSSRSEFTINNGRKAKKPMNKSPIHSKIILGIDKNRELMGTIQSARIPVDRLRNKDDSNRSEISSSMLNGSVHSKINQTIMGNATSQAVGNGLKLPSINSTNSVYEKEQKMYERPRRHRNHSKKDPKLVQVLRGMDNEEDGQTFEERTQKASQIVSEVPIDLIGSIVELEDDDEPIAALVHKYSIPVEPRSKSSNRYGKSLKTLKPQSVTLNYDQGRNLNKILHTKITSLRTDLNGLLSDYLDASDKYSDPRIKQKILESLSPGTRNRLENQGSIGSQRVTPDKEFEEMMIQKSMKKITARDVYQLFGRNIDQMNAHTQSGYINVDPMRENRGKKNLIQLKQQAKINGGATGKQDNSQRNYLQEAIEELPEDQLARLVELLLEEKSNKVNIVERLKQKERDSLLRSELANQLAVQLAQNSSMETIGDHLQTQSLMSNISNNQRILKSHLETGRSSLLEKSEIPLKFQIDAYNNKVDLNKNKAIADTILKYQQSSRTNFNMGQSNEALFRKDNSTLSIQEAQKIEDFNPSPQKQLEGISKKNEKKFIGNNVHQQSIFYDNQSTFQLHNHRNEEQAILDTKFADQKTEFQEKCQNILCINEGSSLFDRDDSQPLDDVIFKGGNSYERNADKSEVLADIYFTIQRIKSRICPVFSGNIGTNMFQSNQKLKQMFHNLPDQPPISLQQLNEYMPQYDNPNVVSTDELDYFEDDEQEQNQSLDHTLGTPAPKAYPSQDQHQLRYYDAMCQLYQSNRDIHEELEKLSLVDNMNYSNFFRTKVQTTDLSDLLGTNLHNANNTQLQVDIHKMSKQYESGLFYLLHVSNTRLMQMKEEIQERNQIVKQKSLKTAKTLKKDTLQKSSILNSESPFKKIDQNKMVLEDTQNVLTLLGFKFGGCRGQKPNSRKFFGCSYALGKFYLFGGVSVNQLNDLRSFSLENREWKCIQSDNGFQSIIKNRSIVNEDKSDYSQQYQSIRGLKSNIPRRFGHTSCIYQNRYLIVFGGAGEFQKRTQRRETFNDICMFDLLQQRGGQNKNKKQAHFSEFIMEDENNKRVENIWVDLAEQPKYNPQKAEMMNNAKYDKKWVNVEIKDIGPPLRRAKHQSAIYGGCMIVHGGFHGESNTALDDFSLFDFALGMWIRFKQPKKNRKEAFLGVRFHHTMTAVTEITIEAEKKNSRIMWIQDPTLNYSDKSDAPAFKLRRNYRFSKTGVFIFGGLNGKNQPQNDIWLLTPHYQRNQKYLTLTNSNFKKSIKPTICYRLQKIYPSGRPPVPRYGHAACFIKNYLVIHGGRNDDIYSSLKNIALNDIHIYDINKNMWMSIILYGRVPTSRWGHIMCVDDTEGNYQSDKLIIFGGTDLRGFCDTSVYQIDFNGDSVVNYIQEYEKMLEEQYAKGKMNLRELK